jgi:flavin reductase (DIM6/NTAB) family NADH-FMN oxidoreductase RutF
LFHYIQNTMKEFTTIKPTDITDNVFKLLDKDWMLVTAGSIKKFNTMTASWGHMGIMWNLPIAIAWIRPQRYTFGFANKHNGFTLSFFTEEYRDALQLCGTKSGRDCDKVAEAGLTPLETERGNVIFKEARLVLECRKVYQDDLKKKRFILPKVAQKHYPKGDFHRFYMGEILNVLSR